MSATYCFKAPEVIFLKAKQVHLYIEISFQRPYKSTCLLYFYQTGIAVPNLYLTLHRLHVQEAIRREVDILKTLRSAHPLFNAAAEGGCFHLAQRICQLEDFPSIQSMLNG